MVDGDAGGVLSVTDADIGKMSLLMSDGRLFG